MSAKQKSEPIAESDASTEESEQGKNVARVARLEGWLARRHSGDRGGKTMIDDESALNHTETVLFDVTGNDKQWGPTRSSAFKRKAKPIPAKD